MTSGAPVVGVAAGAGAVVLLVLLWGILSRRSLARRVQAVAVRLEEGAVDDRAGGTERALARLEHAAERAVARVDEAGVIAQRLQLALEAVPVAVVVGDEHGAPVFSNRRAEPFVAPAQGEVLAEQAVRDSLEAAGRGQAGTRNVELYGPPRRTLVMTSVPVDDGWRGIGSVVVIEDVSQRRRLELMRRDFVANVDEELKVPLGSLAVLAETLATEDDPSVNRKVASRLHTEARRLADVIGDLIELSRIESEHAPRREPVPVHAVLAQAAGRVRGLAATRDIEVALPSVPRRVTIVGERHQLVTAVSNLLENAVECSPRGTAVRVSVQAGGGWVDVAVQDDGIGIPREELDRIFERFYRVERVRPRGRKADVAGSRGSGVGLAIVRHVALSHGGEVLVESTEGVGSRFVLHLPSGGGEPGGGEPGGAETGGGEARGTGAPSVRAQPVPVEEAAALAEAAPLAVPDPDVPDPVAEGA